MVLSVLLGEWVSNCWLIVAHLVDCEVESNTQ